MASITSFLFPEYRRGVLCLLLLHPEMRYHVREIARLTNTTAGSLHRELSKLAKVQVLIREESGNQVYYRANTAFPIFDELASILRKTSGIADLLAEALKPIAKKIEAAFIFRMQKSLLLVLKIVLMQHIRQLCKLLTLLYKQIVIEH